MSNYKGYDIPESVEELQKSINSNINGMPTLMYTVDSVSFNTNITIEEFASADESGKAEILQKYADLAKGFIDQFG